MSYTNSPGGGILLNKDDLNFIAIGMPIMLLVTFLAALGLMHKQIVAAMTTASKVPNSNEAVVVFGSALNAFFCILLLFSPVQFAMMMVLALVACTLYVVSEPRLHKYFFYLAAGYGILLCFLVGIPSLFSAGIMEFLNDGFCARWYHADVSVFNPLAALLTPPRVNDELCRPKWVTFTQIGGFFVIGLTMMLTLALIALAFPVKISATAASGSASDDYQRPLEPVAATRDGGRGNVII